MTEQLWVVEVLTEHRQIIGPFNNSTDAVDWVLKNIYDGIPVNVAPLKNPEESKR